MENNERPKRKVREIVVRGVKALLERLEKKERIIGIVINKEEIMSILPHRGDKLLLDKVTITTDKVIGEFKVTEEVCRGHEIGDRSLFRGVDYVEMAAQLLGVWVAKQAIQHPDLNFNSKIAPLRKASFMSILPSFPGDLLRIEIPIIEREREEGSPRIDRVGREDRPGQKRYQAIALNAGAWVGDMKKAIIYFVELSIRDAQGLAK